MPPCPHAPRAEHGCIRRAIRTSMAIDADQQWSRFDRKNFLRRFAAGLPNQPALSSAGGRGAIGDQPRRQRTDANNKTIGIERIHVPSWNAGKLMHDQHPTRSWCGPQSLGVALMEIVSRPDMRSPAEAGVSLQAAYHPALCRQLRRQYGSGQHARGRQRLRPQEFGTRNETKNVNSVRFVMAVVSEANTGELQVDLIEDGGTVVQKPASMTRTGETRSMRWEDAHDYRYSRPGLAAAGAG